MAISAVEAIPHALPFHEAYRTAAGTLTERESILVRIHTDEGPLGLGESVPLSLRGGSPLAEVRDQLERICAPLLSERPAPQDPAALGAVLDDCVAAGAGPVALCGIDLALHDLLGKLAGTPVWRLLGAGYAGGVDCNGTIDAAERKRAGETAAELAREGYRTLKVKVGSGDDAGRLAAVRAAAGDGIALRVDANGAWSPEQASAAIAALGPLELVEQPCSDLEGMAELRRTLATPIVADESVATVGEAERARELGACDAVTVKLSKVGGIRAATRIAAVLPTYLSSALDGPVGIAAAVHAAAALPRASCAHGLATARMFSSHPGAEPPHCGPRVQPGESPGLGVRIDDEKLDRLRIR